MGLLDDLKREADRVRNEKDAEEARQAELERIYRNAVVPRLIDIHRYLTEMLEYLETVDWVVEAGFRIPGIGQVEGFKQSNYRVHIDSHQAPKKVRLHCACLIKDERSFSVDVMQAEELRQLLIANQAFFTEWPQRDPQGKISSMMFQAKLRVRSELLFEADIPGSRIRITSHNFEGLTSKEYWFGHAAIDEVWLDGLGHYLLRKKSVLGDQAMSEEARENLRRLVDRERSRREGQNPAGNPNQPAPSGILDNFRQRWFKSDKSD